MARRKRGGGTNWDDSADGPTSHVPPGDCINPILHRKSDNLAFYAGRYTRLSEPSPAGDSLTEVDFAAIERHVAAVSGAAEMFEEIKHLTPWKLTAIYSYRDTLRGCALLYGDDAVVNEMARLGISHSLPQAMLMLRTRLSDRAAKESLGYDTKTEK